MQTGQSGRPRGVLGGLAPRGSGEGPGEQPQAGHERGPGPREGGEVRLAGRGSPFRALCSVKEEVVLTESKGGAAGGLQARAPRESAEEMWARHRTEQGPALTRNPDEAAVLKVEAQLFSENNGGLVLCGQNGITTRYYHETRFTGFLESQVFPIPVL